MAGVQIRSLDVRRPEPLTATRHAIEVGRATLRELQTLVGEQACSNSARSRRCHSCCRSRCCSWPRFGALQCGISATM